MKKITIQDITLSALGVAILTLVQVVNNQWKGPGGYSPVDFYFPIAMLFILATSFRVSLLVVFTTPFLWYVLGGVQFYGWASFFMDYWIPLLLTVFISFNSYRVSIMNLMWIAFLSLALVFVRLFFHTWSGVINFETEWAASWAYNLPILTGTMIITPIILVLGFSKAIFLRTEVLKNKTLLFSKKNIAINAFRKHFNINPLKITRVKKIHSGYTNDSYLVISDNIKWQVRVPKQDLVNWEKEKQIYKLLYKSEDCFLSTTGVLIKKWIEGSTVKSWDDPKKLFNEIKKFHLLKPDTDEKLDLLKYEHHFDKLTKEDQNKYISLINKYKKDKLVYCHNDINKKNVLVNQNNLYLIDFEWSCYAPEYFEYAQIKVTEGLTYPGLNKDKLEEYSFIYRIYAYLWTHEMHQNSKIKKLRIELKK